MKRSEPGFFSKIGLLMIFFCLSLHSMQGQNVNEWQKINTAEEICRIFPARMENLLLQINLDAPGLEEVKTAFSQDQVSLACKLLLDYYQNRETAKHLRIEKPSSPQATDSLADLIIRNIHIINHQEAAIPIKPDGHLDWTFHGSADDIEWAWSLNRHHHLQTLLNAYLNTGNPIYAQTINLQLKDWVISSLPYPGEKSNTEMWRGLEVSFRVKVWAKIFFGLMNSGFISPASQLLLLSSLSEHAHYLKNFHRNGNWLTMEMSGLANVATAWPEFKESQKWLQYAIDTMLKSLDEQVYPDGVQTELTSHYHQVALNNFNQLMEICRLNNQPLPEEYKTRMESMWNYLAYTMRPDGHALLNNDSDLDFNRGIITNASEKFQRADWKYIATNGSEGTLPNGAPSTFYPWAGQLIMRSGYDRDAQWAFFDIGPWGTGHQHNDKLHLAVSAYSHDFLVDGGRFAYKGKVAEKFRRYACGSASHNVILFDGKGQAPGPKLAEEPLTEKYFKITDHFDYAWNSFDQFTDMEGVNKHTRALFYVRGKFWVVIDRIYTDHTRKIETLWHWHPNCKVTIGSQQTVTAQNVHGFLQIIPAGSQKWEVNLIKGQEKPAIQGWYSKAYNEFEPNTTSIYSTEIEKETSFAWLISPSEGNIPKPKIKIISEDKNGMTVRVIFQKEGQWDLNIPFSDSSKASFDFKR